MLARSAAPLQFTSGWLSDPPRAYFDFKNVSLGNTESQLAVNAGGVTRLRMSQFSTLPDVVRVVVDCANAAAVDTVVSEQGRLVTIGFGAQTAPVAPVAPVETLPTPPAATPSVRLYDAALETLSTRQSQLTLCVTGVPKIDSAFDTNVRQLTLRIGDAAGAVPVERLRKLADRLVAGVQIAADAAGNGLTVSIAFKRDAGYLIERDAAGIRVLIGDFSITDMLVVIDAGHGGHDTGAIGCNKTCEKDINLDIALRADKLLKAAGRARCSPAVTIPSSRWTTGPRWRTTARPTCSWRYTATRCRNPTPAAARRPTSKPRRASDWRRRCSRSW